MSRQGEHKAWKWLETGNRSGDDARNGQVLWFPLSPTGDSGPRWSIVGARAGHRGLCTAPPGGAPETALTEAARVAVVTKRAEERWALLIKGDVKAAYAYLSPASRAVTSLDRYTARTRTGNFREYKLDRVSCEAETCAVRLFLTFDHRVMQGVVPRSRKPGSSRVGRHGSCTGSKVAGVAGFTQGEVAGGSRKALQNQQAVITFARCRRLK